MGHNIGLQHDCINYNCAHWSDYYVGPRVIDGVECYGYMDYKDDTNYWSPCSVSDLLTYINSLPSGFCLESLGKGNFNSKTLLHIIEHLLNIIHIHYLPNYIIENSSAQGNLGKMVKVVKM